MTIPLKRPMPMILAAPLSEEDVCVEPLQLAQISDSASASLEAEVAFELATAAEVESGMQRVLSLLRRRSGATRVEWWARRADEQFRLCGSDGVGLGAHRLVSLGPEDKLVLVGDCPDSTFAAAVAVAAPILRRRRVEERLTDAAVALARRNEILEEFAAVVAHELKAPLHQALVADDPSRPVEVALDLVDSLLESTRCGVDGPNDCAASCLEQVLKDLGPITVVITAEATARLPLPAASLRVILRNLLRNALAADSQHVHVTAVESAESWRLVVDDDGVGLSTGGAYLSGSGLGLSLCRRIAARYGGVLELTPRAKGGTRATLQSGVSA